MDIGPILLKASAILAVISATIAKIRSAYKKLVPLVEPFIKDVEERAKDGLIDKADRKFLAVGLIERAQAEGKIKKFGFFEKLIVSKVIDWVAGKLPDFTFNVKPPSNK